MSKIRDYIETVRSSWALVAALAAGVVAVGVFLTAYQTDAEAAEWRNAHNQAETCRIVADMKAEIREKEAQIRFDKNLSAEDREWLRQQIDAIRKDIQRYDPDGQC